MRKFERDKSYNCGKYPVDAMEEFFNSRELPGEIQLNECTHIIDLPFFVETSISRLRNNNGNSIFFQTYLRLVELKKLLIKREG